MKKLLIVLFMMVMLYACGGNASEEAGNKKTEGTETKTPVAKESESGTSILVTVKKVAYERFDHFFQANGAVEAVNDAFISPEINGQVKTVHVKEGRRVKKGDLLVSLSADVIKSGVAEVKSALELAKTIYKRRKGLWEKKIGSEVEYLQAKTNKESLENKLKSLEAQLAMTQIKAPINGIIDEVFMKEGELAIPGMQLIQLVNLKQVYVNAEVSEAYLPKLQKGDAAQVSFPSYPELTLDTVIHRTGNVVRVENRTFLVQLKLDNPGEKLKPNIIAILKMKDFSADAAMVVPSIIIKNDLKGTYIYVAEEKEGKTLAGKIYVTTGMSEGGNTMITSGLEPGRQVIIKGYNLVKNGQEVKLGG
ncbi:MAG: efflux RND transporter periplasmic adaptor subunit [bacterium]|nr:efflux RND transporter periplasmic adaptor subunit [bacterium]